MSAFDLGSSLGVMEFGGSEAAAREYVVWVAETRRDVAVECGALSLGKVIEDIPAELGDYGGLTASDVGCSSF